MEMEGERERDRGSEREMERERDGGSKREREWRYSKKLQKGSKREEKLKKEG